MWNIQVGVNNNKVSDHVVTVQLYDTRYNNMKCNQSNVCSQYITHVLWVGSYRDALRITNDNEQGEQISCFLTVLNLAYIISPYWTANALQLGRDNAVGQESLYK